MRPAILAAAAVKYASPETDGPLRLLVVGGSQGARVMADIVPGAIERLEPALWNRLILTQQVREEDMARVRAVYDRLKINAELAPFFSDLPARLAVEPSGGLALRRRHGGRTRRHRPALDPGAAARLRSIRISSPMPACWRRRMARCGFAQGRFHAGPAGRGNLRARRRAGAADRDGSRRPHASAGSMPPSGWPIW